METGFVTGGMKRVGRGVLAACLAGPLALAPLAAVASDHRIALVPGGPHPYFACWGAGLADAAKDFGMSKVAYQVPAEWKLETQTQLLESLAAQGTNAFGIFPGDAVGINSTLGELKAGGLPSIAIAGCAPDPPDGA